MQCITEEYISNNYDLIDAPLVLNKLRKEVAMVTIQKLIYMRLPAVLQV